MQDYKSGRKAHSAQEISQEQRLQIPLYMLVLRDLVGIEPLGGLYRPLAGERKPRGLLRASAKEELPGYTRTDYLDDEEFWARLDTARDDAQTLAQRIREGDVKHDPTWRLVPDVVRSLARVQGGARMNREQQAAVDATGLVFVSAGAGTGKTMVLVERFVRAVCDDGLDVSSVLVITYTKRAAGELRSRIRARCSSSDAPISRASSTARGSRRSTASATGS